MAKTELTLEQTLNKTCLIGLSYFDVQHKLLKQSMLAGTVTAIDQEMGITVSLINDETNKSKSAIVDSKAANFIIPANLACWFVAPKGDFHTSQEGVKITNPDYLVTWDIYQSKDKSDGEQQWWKWYPRTESPQIG